MSLEPPQGPGLGSQYDSVQADAGLASVVIEIGGIPVRLRIADPDFLRLIQDRYAGFTSSSLGRKPFEMTVALASCPVSTAPNVRVTRTGDIWKFERGDFIAGWSTEQGHGWVRQASSPYSIDAVLRILHSVLLAPRGGFLLHAASAVRNGRAFIFSGVSGAGKTTISRLAPPDVTLLTDEISYIVPRDGGYSAFGTPFAGELSRVGENVVAPIQTVFLLAQGPENKTEPVPQALAARTLLRNILFFAADPELVRDVFQSACALVARVPVRRLTFVPDHKVWELIS